MSRKRRIFDIDMPDEPEAPAAGEGSPGRRGPMASAVRENAESLRGRAEAEAMIRAENDALAHEYVKLQRDGLVLRRVPLDQIRTSKLARDRRSEDVEAMRELISSIRAIGLSNPIQLEETAEGYELIQGLRRLTAFRTIFAETGDPAFAAIPAVVLTEGEALEALYRRMVDENLVRKDISFAEMARLARDYAEDPGTEATTLDEAVSVLYGSAAKQKRSYIRAFADLLDQIGSVMRHPEAIPRALGLAVRKRLAEGDVDAAQLKVALLSAETAESELAVLRSFVDTAEGQSDDATGDLFPDATRTAGPDRLRQPKTTFQVSGPQGAAKCTAAAGRLELRLDTDFSAMDRRRLEDALRRFLEDLA